jgi:hypothetical protein
MFMITRVKFRQLLLSTTYALGIAGVIASGGGGGGSDDDDDLLPCGLFTEDIASARDGSGDVWIAYAHIISEGDYYRVVRLNRDGIEQASATITQGRRNTMPIRTIAVTTDGSNALYVGGDFANRILRLNADGSTDNSFSVGTGFNDIVADITPAGDGSGDIYVGGSFTSYNGNPVSGLVRLNSDGSLDEPGFTATGVTDVESVAMAADAPLVGYVYSVGGPSIFDRWENDGTNDASFNPLLGLGSVVAPAADGSGKIYVGGGGEVERVISNGTKDPDFINPGPGTYNGAVLTIVPAGDMTGAVYVGGEFTTFNGDTANSIIRLNNDGSRDANFITGSGFTSPNDPISTLGPVFTVARAIDGSTDIYVGGGFSNYNGANASGIVRLNDDGTLDTGFSVRIKNITDGTCSNQLLLTP